MLIGVLATLLPVALYVALVMLPQGRLAGGAIVVAALALIGAWVAFRNDPSGEILAVTGINAGAVTVAALAQAIRARLSAARPRWLYPALAVGLALAAGVPALNILGI